MIAGDQRSVHTPFVPAEYWSPCVPLIWLPEETPTSNSFIKYRLILLKSQTDLSHERFRPCTYWDSIETEGRGSDSPLRIGALLPTVNAGPMAYAQAFLKLENQSFYPISKVNRLKELFFDFLSTCLVLLTYYYNLMSSVHEAKYRAMRDALDRYRVDLSNLLKEEIIVNEKELRIGPKSSSSSSSSPTTSSSFTMNHIH
ncbi:unnamed protein product [Schistosoma curassoni]|uniref:DHR-2 domain-containing protein n=1 Tax=Schistosoma curassoni TaxID=6186 RepID=A0A183K4Q4_9TREM|nr:unnamed protein product [Schistosoma curassoni]